MHSGDVYRERGIKYHGNWLCGSACFRLGESFPEPIQPSTPGGVAQMVRATDS